MATLLSMVQDAAGELSLPQPTQLFGSGDDDANQWIALAKREGKEFSEMASNKGGWQTLHEEYIFQTSVVTTTGDTTSGSAVITNIPDTSSLSADTFMASGNGIPYQSKIASVDSATQVTLDRPCTATGTTTTIIFGQFAYALPSDFVYFVHKTYWDASYQWELLGPVLAAEKNILRYGVSPTGPRRRFYVKNDRLCLDPMPATDGESIAYDYYSSYWCKDASSNNQTTWAADDDTYRLDDDCFIQGLKWRYLRAKGMDYAEERAEYDKSCQQVMSRDGGSRTLPLNARQAGTRFLDTNNLPDTGYGQ